ncbi:hypothetical protein L195_g048595, partial [Trifolium pratense]
MKILYWNARGIGNLDTRPLNLKRFALNFRSHGIPNLWGFCDINIDPLVLQLSEQHMTFSLS